MPQNSSNYGQRSDELDEIIELPPSWIVRWGITIYFIFLLLLLFGTWIIHYPDLVQVSVQFTTLNAPKPIKAKENGKLIKLLIKEGDVVNAGQILGYLESIANHEQVLNFANEIKRLNSDIHQNDQIVSPKNRTLSANNLGELQPAFQIFEQAYAEYLSFKRNGFFYKKRHILLDEAAQIILLGNNLKTQKIILQRDLNIAMKDFDMQKKLIEQHVIAPTDFRKEEARIIPKEMAIKQIESAILQNITLKNVKEQEILDLDKLAGEEENKFQQALNTLLSSIKNWESHYLLIAPIAGKVFFSSILEEKQSLTNNQEIFYIDPVTTAYYGTAFISKYNIGKVRIGQRTLIKLNAYPYQEFGIIYGKVSYIAEIPSVNGDYIAKIELPNKLTTNTGKLIPYRNSMDATGSIITRDSRLIEKIFYSFKQALSR